MNQAELLRYLVEALEGLGIDYMISGSQASILYGEPRFTQDIDVVAEAASGLKLDVVMVKHTTYDRLEFERRQRQPLLPSKEAYFARPEDVIIYKMLYFREGRSERHLRDIASMLRISGAEIDTRYVDEWAQRLGLTEIWEAVRRRATATDGK